MYIAVHVKYLLFMSDFSEIWIFSTDFRKMLKYQFIKIVQWEPSCSIWTDRHGEAKSLFTILYVHKK